VLEPAPTTRSASRCTCHGSFAARSPTCITRRITCCLPACAARPWSRFTTAFTEVFRSILPNRLARVCAGADVVGPRRRIGTASSSGVWKPRSATILHLFNVPPGEASS
jgi:hypothetical protein